MSGRKTDITFAVGFVQRMIKFREYNDTLRQDKGQSKKDCLNAKLRTHKLSVSQLKEYSRFWFNSVYGEKCNSVSWNLQQDLDD